MGLTTHVRARNPSQTRLLTISAGYTLAFDLLCLKFHSGHGSLGWGVLLLWKSTSSLSSRDRGRGKIGVAKYPALSTDPEVNQNVSYPRVRYDMEAWWVLVNVNRLALCPKIKRESDSFDPASIVEPQTGPRSSSSMACWNCPPFLVCF